MTLETQVKRLSDLTEEQLEKLAVTYKNIEVDRKYNQSSEQELQVKFRRIIEITLFGWKSKNRIDPKFADDLYEKLRITNALMQTVKKVEKETEENEI